MTKQQKEQYREPEEFLKFLAMLKGMKFKLHCGHHCTLGHCLGNDITIRMAGRKVVCSQCGYEGE